MLYVSEWIFVAAAFATGVVALLVLMRLLRAQWSAAAGLALGALSFWMAYLLLGALVALATPRRVLHAGEPEFFDETGVAAIAAQQTATLGPLHARGVFWVVTERLFNRSKEVPHHMPALRAELADEAGNAHPLDLAATRALNPGFDPAAKLLLGPGQSRTLRLVFDVPVKTRRPALRVRHRSRWALNRVLLGDPEHFWHRPTVTLLGP